MGQGRGDKPPTGSLYPRESYVCFFIFLVELAAVIKDKMFSWVFDYGNFVFTLDLVTGSSDL